MYRGPALVVWRLGRSSRSKHVVTDHHTVLFRGASGSAGVTHHAAGNISDPDIEVFCTTPGIVASCLRKLNIVVGGESRHSRVFSDDAGGEKSILICGRQPEFDPGIGCQHPE